MYATHGVLLVERGWAAPIPLVPFEKRPSIKGWEKYNTDVVSYEQAECWGRQFPDHGIGLAAGHGLVAIDLDTDLEAHAAIATDIADTYLGTTSMIRAGRDPRVMRYYRLTSQHRGLVTSKAFHLFSLYATTGQTVLYGIHPVTGKPYEWIDASPLDVGPNDLPAVTEGDLKSFVSEMTGAFPAPANGKHKTNPKRGSPSLASGGVTTDIMRDMAYAPQMPPIEIAVKWVSSAVVGTRHSTMLGAVIALVHAGLGDQEIFDAVIDAHLKSVASDRPAAQTTRVVQNAVQWARRRIGASLDSLDEDLNVEDWSIWS